MKLVTRRAPVRAGAFVVTLVCNLSKPCVGAFLLCAPTELCGAGHDPPSGYGGRIGGSDFVVAAGGWSDIAVSLTSLGRKFISSSGSYTGDVLLDMRDYGDVTVAAPPAAAPVAEANALACRSINECAFVASLQLAV